MTQIGVDVTHHGAYCLSTGADQTPGSGDQFMTYTVFANVTQQDTSEVSVHRTLKGAGKSYQKAHTGNMRRVLDQDGNDVTRDACNAVNGWHTA